MTEIQYHKTKIGELILGSHQSKLCLLDFRYRKMRTTVDNRLKKELNFEFKIKNNSLLVETRKQVEEIADIIIDNTNFDDLKII